LLQIPSLPPPPTAYKQHKQQTFQSFQVVLCVLKIHYVIAPGVRCWPPWGIFEPTLHPSALPSNNIHLAEDVRRLWSRRPLFNLSSQKQEALSAPTFATSVNGDVLTGECVGFFGDLDLCPVGTFL
jgi:hypothetical protein